MGSTVLPNTLSPFSTLYLNTCCLQNRMSTSNLYTLHFSNRIGWPISLLIDCRRGPGGDAQWSFFKNASNSCWDSLILKVCSYIIKMNNFRGDLSDVSAKKTSPVTHRNSVADAGHKQALAPQSDTAIACAVFAHLSMRPQLFNRKTDMLGYCAITIDQVPRTYRSKLDRWPFHAMVVKKRPVFHRVWPSHASRISFLTEFD